MKNWVSKSLHNFQFSCVIELTDGRYIFWYGKGLKIHISPAELPENVIIKIYPL